MTGTGAKCSGTKASHHCLMPSSSCKPICTILHLLYSMHTSPTSTYYHCTALLTAYSAWPEHKSALWLSLVKNKHASYTKKKKKKPSQVLCTIHLHNCGSRLLSCFKGPHAPKGDAVYPSGLSQPIMQAPCGVLAATNSVMYSGQNVQEEGGLRKAKKKT